MSIENKLGDVKVAFLAVTSTSSPTDYREVRAAALGLKKAAQALATEARRQEVRHCEHSPRPNGIYCMNCGVRL